ncbi:hypothetical protein HDU91_006845 [Kappamyces sp. JEL0680]|nr:hypothetical protein HDU91_006845 [Kappamyces sp. JEL0680]
MIGLPYANKSSLELQEKLKYLDLHNNRDDFPSHIAKLGPALGKRRRSLVKDFLCPISEDAVSKRRRAFSMDAHSSNFSVWNVPATSPVLIQRRHSMFETGSMALLGSAKKGVIRPWSVEEDNFLLEAVKSYGAQWTKISNLIPDSTSRWLTLGNRRQCKEHWFRVLSKRPCARGVAPQDPSQADALDEFDGEGTEARRGLWSFDEDSQLLQAFEELGPRWPLIAARVAGRNQRQCEKRYRRIKKLADSEDPPAVDSLAALADVASCL